MCLFIFHAGTFHLTSDDMKKNQGEKKGKECENGKSIHTAIHFSFPMWAEFIYWLLVWVVVSGF